MARVSEAPPCLAEKILCELIVQLLRKEALSDADMAEIAYRLPPEGGRVLRSLMLEADQPD